MFKRSISDLAIQRQLPELALRSEAGIVHQQVHRNSAFLEGRGQALGRSLHTKVLLNDFDTHGMFRSDFTRQRFKLIF